MLKRLPLVATMLAATAVAITGCGDDDKSDSGSKDKATNIAYLTGAVADFDQVTVDGMKKGLAEGAGGSVKAFVSNFDPSKQTQQCLDVVSSGRYNAIVLAAVAPGPTLVPCVEAAKAANIPVVQYGNSVGNDVNELGPQTDGVVGSATFGPEDTAKPNVEIIKQACADTNPCKVILPTIPGDPTYALIEKQVKALPNTEVLQTVAFNYDPATAAKKAPDLLAAHPDVNVFMADTDTTALAVADAVKDAGLEGKVKITGVGGSREGVKAIKDGTLFGTAPAWPLQLGELLAEMSSKAVNGQTIDPNTVNALTIDTPNIVTRDNVDEYTPEWG